MSNHILCQIPKITLLSVIQDKNLAWYTNPLIQRKIVDRLLDLANHSDNSARSNGPAIFFNINFWFLSISLKETLRKGSKDFFFNSLYFKCLFQVDRKQSPVFPSFAEAMGGNNKSDNLSFPSLDLTFFRILNPFLYQFLKWLSTFVFCLSREGILFPELSYAGFLCLVRCCEHLVPISYRFHANLHFTRTKMEKLVHRDPSYI